MIGIQKAPDAEALPECHLEPRKRRRDQRLPNSLPASLRAARPKILRGLAGGEVEILPRSGLNFCRAFRWPPIGIDRPYGITYASHMTAISATAARANLYHLIDQVNEDAEPVTITGQRGNAVLIGESDWRAIQETLFLESVPGFT